MKIFLPLFLRPFSFILVIPVFLSFLGTSLGGTDNASLSSFAVEQSKPPLCSDHGRAIVSIVRDIAQLAVIADDNNTSIVLRRERYLRPWRAIWHLWRGDDVRPLFSEPWQDPALLICTRVYAIAYENSNRLRTLISSGAAEEINALIETQWDALWQILGFWVPPHVSIYPLVLACNETLLRLYQPDLVLETEFDQQWPDSKSLMRQYLAAADAAPAAAQRDEEVKSETCAAASTSPHEILTAEPSAGDAPAHSLRGRKRELSSSVSSNNPARRGRR